MAIPRSILDHLSLGVNDVECSKRFYDAILEPLGYKGFPQPDGDVGYGCPDQDPTLGFSFYIGFENASDKVFVSPSAGFHVAFKAPSREAVEDFHRRALERGGTSLGEPGLRPRYHSNYYAAFVKDPDGHHLEAVFHDPVDCIPNRPEDAHTICELAGLYASHLAGCLLASNPAASLAEWLELAARDAEDDAASLEQVNGTDGGRLADAKVLHDLASRLRNR